MPFQPAIAQTGSKSALNIYKGVKSKGEQRFKGNKNLDWIVRKLQDFLTRKESWNEKNTEGK